MAALLVEADGRPFAIPLDRVERTVRLADHTVRSVAGRRMLVLRDGVLPLVDAAERSAATRADDAELRRRSSAAPASALALAVAALDRPARAGHPPAAARGRRRLAPLSGGAVLSDGRDRPDRRLRRRSTADVAPSPPERERTRTVTPVHRHPARRPARAGQHRLRHRRHRAVGDARPARRHLRARTPRALPLADAVDAARRRPRPRSPASCSRVVGDMRRRSCCCSSRPTTRRRCARCSASRPAPRSARSALRRDRQHPRHLLPQRARRR